MSKYSYKAIFLNFFTQEQPLKQKFSSQGNLSVKIAKKYKDFTVEFMSNLCNPCFTNFLKNKKLTGSS